MIAAVQADSIVGRYRPLLELGRGGMARVYLAESLGSGQLRKLVVLKVLNQDLASDPEMRQAFVREAEISARLNHPNIVNVYEVFEQGPTAVMVMQHLEGMALSDILSRFQGDIPLKLHLNILCQVLDALHYFHELKDANGEPLECVHRDVSPHNVMVLHEGGIKVVDFGVAKVRAQSENQTRTGVIKGKVAYMPPEQLLACGSVDRRADIYSVGVMLWEAVASRRMWRGVDPSARMVAIVRGEIPDIRKAAPGVSDALAAVINRALAHAPDARYASADEMLVELEQAALTEGGHSSPREIAEFMRKNFGEERREKQRAIEKAMADRDFALPNTSWSVSDVSNGSNSAKSPVPGAPPAESGQISVVAPRWRKPAVGALVAVVGLALGTAALLGSEPMRAASEQSAAVAPTPVSLRIESEPPGADVYLEGVLVGVTPLVQTRPRSANPLRVELRALGRVSETRSVSLQEDLTLAFALRSDIQDTQPNSEYAREDASVGEDESAPLQAARASEPERRPTVVRRRQPARPVEASSKQGSAEAAKTGPEPTADNCNPPYFLDSSGVKVFKTQCF